MIVCVRPKLSPDVQARVAAAVRAAGGKVYFEFDVAKFPEPPTVVFGDLPLDHIRRQTELRWVQMVSAGTDRVTLGPEPFPDHVVLTNASGVFGVAGAEHLMGWMLHFARGFGFYHGNQRRGEWVRNMGPARLLNGRTLVVLGLGDIGGNLVRRAQAFGMRIIGVKRTPGMVDGCERVVTTEQLDDVLPLADHLAIALPLTRATQGLMDARRLALLPAGAYVYNVGRGAVIDQDALVGALSSGHLGGAGLDVFEHEPLPPAHPLWSMENVLITPHVGADTPWDNDVAADLFIDNLRRFVAGQPLRNVVDPGLGY